VVRHGPFAGFGGGRSLGVASDPEVGETPAAREQKDVVGLQVAVDDLTVEADEGVGDIREDQECPVGTQGAVFSEIRRQ
jgi:hypothetical protein